MVLYSENRGWKLKANILLPSGSSLLTAEGRDAYRADNHMRLFEAPNGLIFHAGPSKRMHWIDTSGDGLITDSIFRDDNDDAMNGNAVMYDIGKIFTLGGAPKYNGDSGTNHAYVIDVSGGDCTPS